MQKTKLISKTLTALTLFAGLTTAAFAADVAGNWTVTFNTGQGGGSMDLVIEQTGNELKGNVSGDVGNAPINGKTENDTVTFTHQLPDYGVSADYNGKLEGGVIKGTVSFADGAASGNFTAQRKQ
jgi:hypothetical protein